MGQSTTIARRRFAAAACARCLWYLDVRENPVCPQGLAISIGIKNGVPRLSRQAETIWNNLYTTWFSDTVAKFET